jgi:hypothetical protein
VTRIINAARGTRHLPLDPGYLANLQRIIESVDPSVDVQITSAGQPRKGSGGKRTGSTRHDVDERGLGHTSDFVLLRNGRPVRPAEDKDLYSRVIAAAAPSMPGIGHYEWGIHAGGGTPAFWGPDKHGASADPQLAQAYYKGAGREPVNMSLKGRSRMKPALAKGDRRVPIPNATEYGFATEEAAGGPYAKLASLNPDLVKLDPAEEAGPLAKASHAFATGAEALTPQRNGPLLPPPPVIVADAGTPFPDWYRKGFNPNAPESMEPVVVPPLTPDFVPPFGSPDAPYGEALQPWIPPQPNPDYYEAGTKDNSRFTNILTGGIKDALTAEVPNPGAWAQQKVSEWITNNFILSEEEANRREGGGTIPDTSQEFRIADDLLFGGVGEVGGNKTSSPSTGGPGSSTSFEGGTVFLPEKPPVFAPRLYPEPPRPGEVPDRPLAEDIDFQPWLDRMEEYKPEDLNRQEYMKERLLSNLSRAFAAGAGGSGWSGWGGSLARMGGGFGTAQANTTDQWLADDMARDEAQRQWGLGQIDLEMKLAQRSQDLKNQNAQTTYSNELDEYNQGTKYDMEKYNVDMRNIDIVNAQSEKAATDFYNWTNTIGKLRETTVSDVTDKHVVLQHVDGEGKRTFELIKLDDPYSGMLPKEYLDQIKSMEQVYGNSPDVYKMKYAPMMMTKSKLGFQAVMAEELLQLQVLPNILPQYEEVEKQAAAILEKRGQYPGGSGYDKEYLSVMTALVTPLININDANFLQQAAQFNSIGALMLLGAAAQNAPAALPPGPPLRPTGQ